MNLIIHLEKSLVFIPAKGFWCLDQATSNLATNNQDNWLLDWFLLQHSLILVSILPVHPHCFYRWCTADDGYQMKPIETGTRKRRLNYFMVLFLWWQSNYEQGQVVSCIRLLLDIFIQKTRTSIVTQLAYFYNKVYSRQILNRFHLLAKDPYQSLNSALFC